MKVSSPVGQFPFTLEHMRIDERELVMAGRIGAWPSEIRLSARDIAEAARIAVFSLAAGLAGRLTGPLRRRMRRPSA
jgi:hypothetical protein